MKIIFITLIFAILFFFGKNNKSNLKNNINTKTVESVAFSNPNITSITFTKEEIIGASHFGFKYDFNIKIDSSNNLDILSFCKEKFQTILPGRVVHNAVIISILKDLHDGKYDIDENPKGLRLTTSTSDFDTVEVEIFLKEGQLLKMDLKYYSPL